VRITSIVSLISLRSLPLGVAQVLANRRKDILIKNKHIKPSQNKQYYNSNLVIFRRGEK
jgi:hypothetical protein